MGEGAGLQVDKKTSVKSVKIGKTLDRVKVGHKLHESSHLCEEILHTKS